MKASMVYGLGSCARTPRPQSPLFAMRPRSQANKMPEVAA